MGPYCQFCGQRCFVHFPDSTPEYILEAYRLPHKTVSIIATCPEGQQFEKETIGYCYQDIIDRQDSLEAGASKP